MVWPSEEAEGGALWFSYPGDPDIEVVLCEGELIEGRLNTEGFCECMGEADAVVDASREIRDSRFPGMYDGDPEDDGIPGKLLAAMAFSKALPAAAGVEIVAEAVDFSIVAFPGGWE